jgi:methylated-DNA-[protein]-cysteine S-methyltransferase
MSHYFRWGWTGLISIFAKKVDDVWFGVACEGERVYATTFAFDERKALQSLRETLPFNVIVERSDKFSGFAERAVRVLKDVYDGKDVVHDLPFDMERLSGYTRRVIEAVCQVPVGYVASYGSVAKAVGGSPRAVGHVMAMNPFAPVCPCHRVVGADFGLCGYGGGLDVKLEFLKRERRGFSSEKEILVGGRRLKVFPVESVLRKAAGSKC